MKQIKFLNYLESEIERIWLDSEKNHNKKQDTLMKSLNYTYLGGSINELRKITYNYQKCFNYTSERDIYKRINKILKKIEKTKEKIEKKDERL